MEIWKLITLRTAIVKNNEICTSWAGIVADSVPEKYFETINKSAALFKAMKCRIIVNYAFTP